MNLSVKKMNDEDIPFIFEVFEQNRNVLHENHTSLEEWTEYFTNSDTSGSDSPYESHHIIVADDCPAAWLKINGWNEPEIWISMLVVDDFYKHKGVGKFAIQFAEKTARYWAKSAIRFQTTRDNDIAKDCYLKCGYEIVREPDGPVPMIYKVGDGIDREGYEFKKIILPEALTEEALTNVLSKMFGAKIISTDFQTKQLQGGTVGDVRLISGNAQAADGSKLPYNIVLKVQRKCERDGDPDSWRREYDFCKSDFGMLFSESFRWPECYYAEINEEENETQIWMEYIDGLSGNKLTAEMLQQATYELGRFQGKLYAEQPGCLQNQMNLSQTGFVKEFSQQGRSSLLYDYIRSNDCGIPKHLCKMFIDIDENAEDIWNRIEKLPIVLSHRDFWVANILYADGKIILIDWDTTGWGYLGEDIASLIVDETDIDHMVEYYQRCVPAYYKGFSDFVDVSHITDHCIHEFILLLWGYRIVEWYKFAESSDEKALHLNTLQKIYEMGGNTK